MLESEEKPFLAIQDAFVTFFYLAENFEWNNFQSTGHFCVYNLMRLSTNSSAPLRTAVALGISNPKGFRRNSVKALNF